MAKQRWWKKIVIGVVILLSGWGLYISSKQIERNRRIQDEVSSLEVEAVKIRRENETLSEKIDYFSSDNFREQEAKKKLGLKKAEETVVIIKPQPEQNKGGDASLATDKRSSENVGNEASANYEKWWKIFF